jgi:hypothetical protein
MLCNIILNFTFIKEFETLTHNFNVGNTFWFNTIKKRIYTVTEQFSLANLTDCMQIQEYNCIALLQHVVFISQAK